MSVEIRELNLDEIFSSSKQITLQTNQAVHVINHSLKSGNLNEAMLTMPTDVMSMEVGGLVSPPVGAWTHSGRYLKDNWPALLFTAALSFCTSFIMYKKYFQNSGLQSLSEDKK